MSESLTAALDSLSKLENNEQIRALDRLDMAGLKIRCQIQLIKNSICCNIYLYARRRKHKQQHKAHPIRFEKLALLK